MTPDEEQTEDKCEFCQLSRDKNRMFCSKCGQMLWKEANLIIKTDAGNSHQGWH